MTRMRRSIYLLGRRWFILWWTERDRTADLLVANSLLSRIDAVDLELVLMPTAS